MLDLDIELEPRDGYRYDDDGDDGDDDPELSFFLRESRCVDEIDARIVTVGG